MEEKTKFNIGKIFFSSELGECDVFFYVETEEKENCFHIKNANREFIIGISRAKYYNENKLSDIEKSELINFLNGNISNRIVDQLNPSDKTTIWTRMSIYWNFTNDNDEIPINAIMPDYNNL